MATYSGNDKRIKYLFENGGGGGSSSLAGLSDVNLSSPTDGQVLTYHASSGKWINATGSAGGGVNYSTTEQVVGTWIDGSTLYERTYFLDNISSSATEYVVDNSFGNNKTMHSMDVQFSGMTNTLGKYIDSISDTLYVDSGVLKYYITKTGSWWNALNSCYITIRYTKSS